MIKFKTDLFKFYFLLLMNSYLDRISFLFKKTSRLLSTCLLIISLFSMISSGYAEPSSKSSVPDKSLSRAITPHEPLLPSHELLLPSKVSTKSLRIQYDGTMDRVQLVTQQINLLKNRLSQGDRELAELQAQHEKEVSEFVLEKASKNLLDKASLDILVYKSNLDSINIELTDCQQTIGWLNKNIQETESQLNVLSIFGLKIAKNELINVEILRTDLNYQKKLLNLEKDRLDYLHKLQTVVSQILSLKNDQYNRLNTLLKSRKMFLIKQQQVKDELAYQEQQNYWLQELNVLYAKISKIDPTARDSYSSVERDIFYANENANYAYIESLVARYKDQIQQMKLSVLKSSSISLLNEISDQVQSLSKQISRLDSVLQSRVQVLQQHVSYLSSRNKHSEKMLLYVGKLSEIVTQYRSTDAELVKLGKNLAQFRTSLEKSLQEELSSRQGFPVFEVKTLLDLGKELLKVPALTFQITKSLYNKLIEGISSAGWVGWILFIFAEIVLVNAYFSLRKILKKALETTEWRDKVDSKWLSLQWLQRNFFDILIIGNIVGVFYFFDVPLQNYIFIVYLFLVWLIFKSILLIARLYLVETTQDTDGHNMRLYLRLKWIIRIAGIITALTVFVHLLPLIYELKSLCDRLFLLLLMIVSLMLLRSWDVLPNLMLSHIDVNHPYLQKSIRLIGRLIPILMFGNSVIGLFGYVNLIMTVSWYEGIFLIVLIGYLLLRGLLSDGMEQLSRLMIQYVSNGWLWTEAFLKPLDKVLRITLFLTAWVILFLLYGWDKQSPIVEQLTSLLHYKLASALNTVITPLSIIELSIVISIFYWTAKWTREFVYRLLLSRTKDLGIRNSIAILSQYTVVVVGIFICLRVLGVDLTALAAVAAMFAFGIGLGLRDLANNFASGFLLLLERPLRVGDIVNINNIEGEVTNIGSRAVTIRTWDFIELVVPNAEIFNKSFMNWTARDNIVRSVTQIKISRHDNPHQVKILIQNVLSEDKDILKEPIPEVYLKEMNDSFMIFELRYYVNIRQVKSKTSVMSTVLMSIWDTFALHGIKPPHPQREIVVRRDEAKINLLDQPDGAN